jgi:hypothetical protein
LVYGLLASKIQCLVLALKLNTKLWRMPLQN